MFFKGRKKKRQEDLNQTVSRYRRWWQQNQAEDSPAPRSFKANKRTPESSIKAGQAGNYLDDTFVYYEGN